MQKQLSLLLTTTALLAATVATGLPLAGCGGSSGGSGTASAGTGGISDAYVNSRSEASYSSDAKVLTARAGTTPLLSAATATDYDKDLARIRQSYPVVSAQHARPEYTLQDLLVTVGKGSSLAGVWDKGTVLPTGQKKLDALLTQYNAAGVSAAVSDPATGNKTYKVTFGQSLSIPPLATTVGAASTDIVRAYPNFNAGDGDNLTFTRQSSGAKQYDFSVGWGDCQAGCVNRHTWTVTIAPDNSLSLRESGPALPATL